MSVDLIGWETLKTIDFMKILDQSLAIQESLESALKQIKIGSELMEDGFGKEMMLVIFDTITDFFKLQRVQIIWINALREGMMEIESRFDKLDQDK